MGEKLDPYFEGRLQKAQNHRVIETIAMSGEALEVEPNKELPSPVIEGTIEEFGWCEKAVKNIIDALESGRISIEQVDAERVRISFLPIEQLPEQLGHVSEINVIKTNLKSNKVFGSGSPDDLTYLQTTDFAVEGYLDDEKDGKRYGRIYVDARKLNTKRNVYLDPESLHVTEYEYGSSFCVKGGIPLEAITRIDIIQARKLTADEINGGDTEHWIDDPESYMDQQAQRLREYLNSKRAATS